MKFNIIVAICKKNNGIGLKGHLPWDIKEDLHHFSKLTKGKGNNAVVMGSNTYNSLYCDCLPGRDNFILSNTLKINFTTKNGKNIVKTFTDIDAIIESCLANNYETAWIIGGGDIYRQFLKKKIVDTCYVTSIDRYFDCDITFPLLSANEWKIISNKELLDKYNDKYDFNIEYIEYSKL